MSDSPLDRERWTRVRDLFTAARERAPGERARFLAERCGDDSAMRREVEALLAAPDGAAALLDHPPDDGAVLARAGLGGAPPPRHLMAGQRAGPYEIVAFIGAGGMGEVYRAHDSRLHRDVALKVLPPALTADPDRRRRFVQEARAASALEHPHIAVIHEIGEADGATFIAMELVRGHTLADAIARGALAIGRALEIAIEIAEGLARAHGKGIVHRDLKPANVMLTEEGHAKIIDFGLAKLLDGGTDGGQSETHSRHVTGPGIVLGTASYMSPEQVRGEAADHRSDVFSFGILLYEMLTGRPPFRGNSGVDTMHAILHAVAPPLPASLASTASDLQRIVDKCLAKNAADRYQGMRDAVVDLRTARRRFDSAELGQAALLESGASPSLRDRSGARSWKYAALATLAIVVATAAFVILRPRTHGPTDRARWTQLTNLDVATQPALSPDGRMLTFIRGQGTFTTDGQVYLKMLPDGDAVPLTQDTRTKMSPVFSPDGSRVAYTVNEGRSWNTWIVLALRGEPHEWLSNASGLTWSAGNTLLYSAIRSGNHMGIATAAESGADARDVYFPENDLGMAHRAYRSPDGRNVLLVEMDASGRWMPCRVVPFDGTTRGRAVGPPDAPCTSGGWSPDGKWIYVSSSAGGAFHVWRQRVPDGSPEQITTGPTEEEGIAVAPDGRSLITSVGLRVRSVWIHEPQGDRQMSLEGYAYAPLMSADGRRVCYRVTSAGGTGQTPSALWAADVRTGASERLLPGQMVTTFDLSRENRLIAAVQDGRGKGELWLTSLDRREPPRRIGNVEGDNPRFAGDGTIIFRAPEGNGHRLCRVRVDGSGLEKLSSAESSVFGTVSPAGRWVSIADGGGLTLYSVRGETSVRFMSGVMAGRVRWSADGSHLYVSLQVGEASAFAFGRTYVIPLRPGQDVPPIPTGGFRSEADFAAIPGVRVLPHGDVGPGPTADTYAFSQTTITRNLYRIPLPD